MQVPPQTTPPPIQYPTGPPGKHDSSLRTVIVVLAVVFGLFIFCAVGAAVLFPVFAQARLAAKRTATMGHLKELAVAAQSFAHDHEGVFPDTTDLATFKVMVTPYVNDPQAFEDPATGTQFDLNPNLNHVKAGSVRDPDHTVLITQSHTDSTGKVYVGYMDGRAKTMSEAELNVEEARDAGDLQYGLGALTGTWRYQPEEGVKATMKIGAGGKARSTFSDGGKSFAVSGMAHLDSANVFTFDAASGDAAISKSDLAQFSFQVQIKWQSLDTFVAIHPGDPLITFSRVKDGK